LAGSRGNLIRFDGQRFTNHVRDDVRVEARAIAGTSAEDVWAGNYQGLFRRVDGRWQPQAAPVNTATALSSIGGGELLALSSGYLRRWDGARWNDVSYSASGGNMWASSASNVWLQTLNVVQWDGMRWNEFRTTSHPYWLLAIAGSAASNVWGVGSDQAWRFDGATWKGHYTGSNNPRATLNAVSTTGPDDVWAVGNEGVTRHFDGLAFINVPSGVNLKLTGVWATDRTRVTAIGEQGTILRWSTDHWVPQTSGLEDNLLTIWGAPNGHLWVVGGTGMILQRRP
jgi:hypothetical protein